MMGKENDLPLYDVEIEKDAAGDAIAVAVEQVAVDKHETIEVIAPTDMAAGFQFSVDAGKRQLRVAVPQGGVISGQRFAAIVVSENAGGVGGDNQNPHAIPTGRWRDDLCDCCKFGCCHPQCCLTFWCASCAVAQVMTRLKLDWCARALNGSSGTTTAFRVVFIITCVYLAFGWITEIITSIGENNSDDDSKSNDEPYVEVLCVIQTVVEIAFVVFVVLITCRTRSHIRKKYDIPTRHCGDCEGKLLSDK